MKNSKYLIRKDSSFKQKAQNTIEILKNSGNVFNFCFNLIFSRIDKFLKGNNSSPQINNEDIHSELDNTSPRASMNKVFKIMNTKLNDDLNGNSRIIKRIEIKIQNASNIHSSTRIIPISPKNKEIYLVSKENSPNMKDISCSPDDARQNLHDYKTNFKTMNSVKQLVNKKSSEQNFKSDNGNIETKGTHHIYNKV